jgi:hypothetical protein
LRPCIFSFPNLGSDSQYGESLLLCGFGAYIKLVYSMRQPRGIWLGQSKSYFNAFSISLRCLTRDSSRDNDS